MLKSLTLASLVALHQAGKTEAHYGGDEEQYSNDIIGQGSGFFDFTTVTFDSQEDVDAYWDLFPNKLECKTLFADMVTAYTTARTEYETYKQKYEAYTITCTTCKGISTGGEYLVRCGNECRTRAECCAYH